MVDGGSRGRRTRRRHDRGVLARPLAHPGSARVVERVRASGSSAVARLRHRLDVPREDDRARSWDDVVDDVLRGDEEVVSIDVVDTLLLPRVVGAENRWRIVGRRLAADDSWSGDVEPFAGARRAARPVAETPSRTGILEEQELPALDDRAHAASVEIATERELVRAAPGARRALDRLRDGGRRIVLRSDMHLSGADTRELLARAALWRDDLRLVVSGDAGVAAPAGRGFERSTSEPVVHVGDARRPDAEVAERAAVRAVAVPAGRATRLEERMAEQGVTGGAIAGAARAARLAPPPVPGVPSSLARALAEAGADVAGQVLTAFLLWAREQCEADGLRTVRFLTRDGVLPLRLAQAMPDDHWGGHDLGLLHASRRAWGLAAATPIGLDAWLEVGTRDARAFVDDKRLRVPFASLLSRLGLEPADLGGHPALAGLDPSAPLPAALVTSWEELLDDPDVRRRITARSSTMYDLIVDHLSQEGLLATPLALVDVGWRGQLAWQVSKVVRGAGGHEPVHLHIGGANVATWLDRRVDIRRFAFDDAAARLPYPQVVASIESFTASGEAPVTSFRRRDDGEVVPVLGDPEPAIATPERDVLWAAAIATARGLPDRATLADWGGTDEGLAAAARAVLHAHWTAPEQVHGVAANALGYEVDDRGMIVHRVAVPYSLSELLTTGERPGRQWREGSLAITHPALRVPLRAVLRLRDAARALARRAGGVRRLVGGGAPTGPAQRLARLFAVARR